MKNKDYWVTVKDFLNAPQTIAYTNKWKKALKGMTKTELKIIKKELLTNAEFIELLCFIIISDRGKNKRRTKCLKRNTQK